MVGKVRAGTGAEQSVHDIRTTSAGRDMDGGEPVVCDRVRVGTGFEKSRDDIAMTGVGRRK